MTDGPIKVLLVEDDEDDYVVTRDLLGGAKAKRFELTWVATYQEALAAVIADAPDVCLVDYRLGEKTGVELLEEMYAHGHQPPAILLTSEDSQETDLRAMAAGAADYLVKGQIDRPLLERSIRYAIQHGRTLAALRASEMKYRQIVETTAEGVWILDNQSRAIYVNRRMAEMLGYTVDEMISRPVFDFVDEGERAEVWARLERRRHGIIEQYESCFRRRNGAEMWALISASPITGPDGEFVGALGMVTDITERKQAELELKRLAAIVESSDDAILSKTLDGIITSWNASAERMYGYLAEEAIGRHVSFVVPPERAEQHQEIMGMLRRGEHINHLETVRLRKDGSRIDVSLSISPIRDDRGGVIGASTIARDITERKHTEQELKKSEDRYRELVENANDIIYSLDLEGNVTSVNHTILTLTGHSPEEVVGRSVGRLLPPGEMEVSLANFRLKALNSVETTTYETEMVCKDGSRLAVEVNSHLLYEGSRPVGIHGVARDITQRKRAEEERDRFFDLSQDMLGIANFDGYFTRVNPAWSKTLGYTEEELLSVPFAEFVHPDDRSPTAAEVAHLATGGHVHGFENRYRCKDGSYRWLSWGATSVVKRQTIYAIARDITERRQLEEQFRQAQKLEAIGRLAGGVAHDFNNLLTVINGYSELAMESLQPEDPLRRSIQEINRAGERAAGLTRQLLAFSRRQVMQPKVLDINSIVADMEKMLRRLIGEDIELCTALKPNLGSIKADPGQIEQVIMNLAVNARDAMPEGGKLNIETDVVYLDSEYAGQHIAVSPGSYVLLAVSDTGCGMNEETKARIFEPFFTTKELGQGTGLGLSTVYGIVKQSGGSIWVYSEVGRGTTFKVYLPLIDQEAEDYKRSLEPEEFFQGAETILLVEDEEMVRRLAREVLEMYGYRVLEAANGGSALLICEQHQETIDLLLTDLIMPEMSGRTLASRLGQLRPEMKVLYMSGYTDDTIVHHHLLDSGLAFLQKPFTPVGLARRVREVLDTARNPAIEK